MQSDMVKLWITHLTAAIIAIGSLGMAAWAWASATPERDLAILFGLLGSSFGASSAFLFSQESATRAVRSYQSGLNATAESSSVDVAGG